jgi:dihydrofolate reductase
MRKVILSFGMTLDGYIARPDHRVDFLPVDKEASKIMSDFFRTIDAAIMGRKTAEISIKMYGGKFPAQGLSTYVFSRSWTPGERDGFEVVKGTPGRLIRRLREQKGKHIFLMGGGELGRSFLKADLVDELFIGVVPILLGKGIPGFPAGFPQRDFSLVECKTYSKGLIVLKYHRMRSVT